MFLTFSPVVSHHLFLAANLWRRVDDGDEARRTSLRTAQLRQPKWPRLGILLGTGVYQYKMVKMQKRYFHAVLPATKGKIKLD